MGNIITWKSTHRLMMSVLVCLAVSAGLNTMSNGFVSDDFILVDVAVRAPFWHVFISNWLDEKDSGGFYRPVTNMFWKLDTFLYGRDARGYHLTNIILHIAVVLLVFRFLFLIGKRRSVAFTGAALFSLHPIHTEAIAWISGRTDLTASLFYLWGLVIFFGTVSESRRRVHAVLRYGSVLLLGMLAMLSKEIAYTFPLMVTAFTVLFSRRTHRVPRWFYLFLWMTPVCILILRRLALGTFLGGYGASRHLRFDMIIFGYFKFYLRWMLTPFDVAARHDTPLENIVGAAAIALLFLAFFRRRFRSGALFFTISIIPVLNICRPQYLYLPSLGLLWLLAELLHPHHIRRNVVSRVASLVVTIFLLSGYLLSTAEKNLEWTRTAWVGEGIRLTMMSLHPQPASGTRFVFITPPVNNRIPIGVFQNGLTQAIRLWYNDLSLEGLSVSSRAAYETYEERDIVFEFRGGKIFDRTREYRGETVPEHPWKDNRASGLLDISHPIRHVPGSGKIMQGLCIYSQLSQSAGIEQGTPVGDVIVHFSTGEQTRFTLKAGLDTAEWAWDRPDVRSAVRHRRAPIAYSYISGDVREPPIVGHVYRSVCSFGSTRSVESMDIEFRADDIPKKFRRTVQWDIKGITYLFRKESS